MTTQPDAPLTLTITDKVAEIVLCRGAIGNPFDERFGDALLEAADACADIAAVRAVLIRAEGKMFSVGGDLRWLSQSREGITSLIESVTAKLNLAIARLASGPAPVVIAVQGMAAGGALGLASSADFLLASPSAQFYPAFPAIGFPCDCGCSYFLPKLVGRRRAIDFLMLNETWSAAQALEFGLVSRVIEEEALVAEARALAARLAAGPTHAFGELKRLLLAGQPLETQLKMEAAAVAKCARTDDSWNAIKARLEKQIPVFNAS